MEGALHVVQGIFHATFNIFVRRTASSSSSFAGMLENYLDRPF